MQPAPPDIDPNAVNGDDDLTVSATECARLTGISRERLRTWERRHGFPIPERAGAGPRRYLLADVGTLITVRRGIDGGMPVAAAIAAAQAAAPAAPDVAALAEALDRTPTPTLVLEGPHPARVVYANRAARGRADTPALGSELDGEFAERLVPAFAASDPVRLERPSWDDPSVPVSCVAAPIDAGAGPPLLALYDLEAADAQDQSASAAAAQNDLERVQADLAERDAALDLSQEVAQALKAHAGVDAIIASVELMLRRLGAVDVALAPYMTGQIVIGRSARGLLGPEMLTVAALPDVASAIREGEITTLPPDAATGLAIPEGLGALIVPATCAGEPLAVLVLVFDGTPALGSGALRALTLLGTALGLALMQERLLTDEAGAGR